MARYRMYLVREDGRTDEKTFSAVTNYDAIQIAERIAKEEGEKCRGYEVWQKDRRIKPKAGR